jgi:hypothetical protein
MTLLSLFCMKSDDRQFQAARVAEKVDNLILEVIHSIGS